MIKERYTNYEVIYDHKSGIKNGVGQPQISYNDVNDHSTLLSHVDIAKATNTSPESWLKMQSKLDLWKSEQKILKVIPFPSINNDYQEIMEG